MWISYQHVQPDLAGVLAEVCRRSTGILKLSASTKSRKRSYTHRSRGLNNLKIQGSDIFCSQCFFEVLLKLSAVDGFYHSIVSEVRVVHLGIQMMYLKSFRIKGHRRNMRAHTADSGNVRWVLKIIPRKFFFWIVLKVVGFDRLPEVASIKEVYWNLCECERWSKKISARRENPRSSSGDSSSSDMVWELNEIWRGIVSCTNAGSDSRLVT